MNLRLLSVAAVTAAFCLHAVPAHAGPVTATTTPTTTTYHFTGKCDDCTSPTGTLVLQNYSPGTYFSYSYDSSNPTDTDSPFISFTYTSSVFSGPPGAIDPISVSYGSGNFSVSGSAGEGPSQPKYAALKSPKIIAGGLPDQLYVSDYATGYVFQLYPDGGFCVGNGGGGGAAGDCSNPNDMGSGGRLSSTPEPGSLALLGTGVMFTAGAVRRRYFR